MHASASPTGTRHRIRALDSGYLIAYRLLVFLDELPPSFVVSIAVILGLNFGSFLNVVIYRLPLGYSVSFPGSHCTQCKKPIAFYNNIPLLSWLLLRGRSRCCQTKISVRYFLVELIGGLVAGAIVVARLLPRQHELLVWEAALLFLLYLALALGLIAAAAIDFEHMILPDSLTWGGTALGLLSSPFRPEVDPLTAPLGAFIGYLGIWLPFIWAHTKLRGFPGMGLGDAKLMALAGAWFGPLGVLLTLFGGALQGTLFAAVAFAVQGKIDEPKAVQLQRQELLDAIEAATGEEKQALEQELNDDPLGRAPEDSEGGPRIAFGPFLALTLVELLLFHELIITWMHATLFLS